VPVVDSCVKTDYRLFLGGSEARGHFNIAPSDSRVNLIAGICLGP